MTADKLKDLRRLLGDLVVEMAADGEVSTSDVADAFRDRHPRELDEVARVLVDRALIRQIHQAVGRQQTDTGLQGSLFDGLHLSPVFVVRTADGSGSSSVLKARDSLSVSELRSWHQSRTRPRKMSKQVREVADLLDRFDAMDLRGDMTVADALVAMKSPEDATT